MTPDTATDDVDEQAAEYHHRIGEAYVYRVKGTSKAPARERVREQFRADVGVMPDRVLIEPAFGGAHDYEGVAWCDVDAEGGNR